MAPPHHRSYHEIHTPRLLLRSILPKDLDAVFVIRTDPLNHKFLVIEPGLTREKLRARHEQWTEDAANGRRAKMVITLKDDQQADSAHWPVIGISGINDFGTAPNVDKPGQELLTASIGIILDSKYPGKGYGYEAVKAAIEYCFDEMEVEQLLIETRVRNKGMMNIMDKLGLADAGKVIPLKINNEDGFDAIFTKRMWDEAQCKRSG